MNTHTVNAHAIGARYALLRQAYPQDDRNELMITAWLQVLGREPRFPSDVEEGLADILGEGEVSCVVAAVMVIIKDTATAARLVAMGQEKILVAPSLILGVPSRIMLVAGPLIGRMESDGVFEALVALIGQKRGQVAAAAKPALARADEAGVHMDGGNPWAAHMGD